MSKLIKSPIHFGCLALLLLSMEAQSSDTENELVPSEEYIQCHEELKKQNINLAQRLIFCHTSGNELVRKISAFKDCSVTLQPRLKDRTGEVCLTEFDNLSLLNAETLQCLDSTLNTASPGFVSNISSNFLNDFIRILPDECNDFPQKQIEHIKLHSTYTFATGERLSEYEIGGLSGITYNPLTNSLSAVSDQRGLKKNLVFNFNLNLGNDSVQVTPESVLVLRPQQGNKYFDVDMESIVLSRNGDYIISAEAPYGSEKSFIHSFSNDGSLLEAIPMPAKYFPEPGLFKGIRINKGFEGLGISPDGNKIFTANEDALFQDQIPGRRVVRILTLNKNGSSFTPDAEYFYEIEDIPDNGLVEILALSQNELLILERGYNSRLHKVTARLYRISLNNASSVIQNESLKDVVDDLDQLKVKKELLLDFDDITPFFPAGLRRLDNLEGMALGPKTRNGKQSLIFISDNNMSSTQVTQFVILEI